MIYKNGCWMCGGIANSREHRYKRTELNRFAPNLNRSKQSSKKEWPISISFESGNLFYIKSLDADRERYPPLICEACNTTNTQNMDLAYDQLSKWCWENPEASYINLHELWGNNYLKKIELFYGYCLKILGCEILNSNARLPKSFPNPLRFDLKNPKLKISVCKPGGVEAIFPSFKKEMINTMIGKGCLFGGRNLNCNDELKQQNTKITGITSLVWYRLIGNYQINFWYNIDPNPLLGAVLDGASPVYEVPDLQIDCFDMDYFFHGWAYGVSYAEWLLGKSEKGSPWHQYKLALLYAKGKGVEKNSDEAFSWCQKAAESSLPSAVGDLGYMCLWGLGVEKNIEKAIELLNLAAEDGYSRAENNLGYIHEKGIGVDQNYEKAKHYYESAAHKGDEIAQYNLGSLYFNGLVGEQNLSKAIHFWTLAANQGNPMAQNNLACLLADGIGADKDERKAMEYWKSAAAQEHIPSQKNLQKMNAL